MLERESALNSHTNFYHSGKWLGFNTLKYYFAADFMNRKYPAYNFLQMISAMLMILALLWLTMSAPFVYAAQLKIAAQEKGAGNTTPSAGNDEEAPNPFGNTTEEKAPTNSSSFSEEYLHDNHKEDYVSSIISQYHKCENAGTYHAFHGELLVPPPNVA